jgi:hypothetical protein
MKRWALLLAVSAGCVEYDLATWDTVDVYHQNPVEEVDILLVVDNSCSMQPYQQKLGDSFDVFISWFIGADIDYHIGVVTTDIETALAGQIRGEILTRDSEDAAAKFAQSVNVGTLGSPVEMGLESAELALTEPLASGSNLGFLRQQASLSIIFVSDEEDGSPIGVNNYINAFFDVKGHRERDIFNGSALTVTDINACTAEQAQASTPGTRYVDVARQTGGMLGNLCAEDFEEIVVDLSLNSSRMRDTFFLSGMPAVPSLQVNVNDEAIDCSTGQWTYDIVLDEETGLDTPAVLFAFDSIPVSDSKIAIRYDDGDGDPAAFCSDGGA